MRTFLAPLAMMLSAASGCALSGAEEKPNYATDSVFTRPWATCLATSAEEKDDGVSDAWTIAQAVAEECSPDLLSAFRRETTEKDKRKAYALTAEKAEALVLSNRRDRASSAEQAPGDASAAEPMPPETYGMGTNTR